MDEQNKKIRLGQSSGLLVANRAGYSKVSCWITILIDFIISTNTKRYFNNLAVKRGLL